MMIYIPKENINKVHLDQSVHNTEYFHPPRKMISNKLIPEISSQTFPAIKTVRVS